MQSMIAENTHDFADIRGVTFTASEINPLLILCKTMEQLILSEHDWASIMM